jgi:FMN reductase (NADPH)
MMLRRVSIRRFKKEPVKENDLDLILLAGQRSPSPGGFQAYSLIVVNDSKKRSRISEAVRQSFVKEAPVFVLVCVDMRRFRAVLDRLGHDYHLKHGSGLYAKLFSIVEASIVAQSMAAAALFMGLGSCFVGAVFYAMKEITDILDLPLGVIPLVGLCLGHPDESPPPRPRWPLRCVVHVNKYQDISTHEIDSYLKLANEAMEDEGYYRKYSGKDASYEDHLKWKTQSSEWIRKHDDSAKEFLIRNDLRLT